MPPTYSYLLTTHLAYTPSNSTTLALIKRGPTLDPITPLATQLHILNLFGGEETPYESLHAVVSNGVKPWFDAFVGARGQGKDGDNKMGECRIDSRLRAYGETHATDVYGRGVGVNVAAVCTHYFGSTERYLILLTRSW